MAHAKNHDYHILNPSIWPFVGAISAFVMLFGAVLWMHDMTAWLFWMGFVGVLYTMFAWWSETITENKVGDHTPVVLIGLRMGFILFVMSEVMFFSAWFWSFIKHAMYPMYEYIGTEYVPPHIHAVDAFHLPLINTLILLLSGCAVTWAHHALVHGNVRKDLINGLAIGIALGALFTVFQGYEYWHLLAHEDWQFGGDQYFSNFFMATGFHGFHVLVGTIFLIVCLLRSIAGDFTETNHVGFEAAAWYWHFVDVVWLFLFFVVYLWGAPIT
ncbi:MAG: cytochrome c oxidase subunit 3 [Paracoccaceae bacterium]